MATEIINLGGGESVDVTYDKVTITVDDNDPQFFVRYKYIDRFGNSQTAKLTGELPSANAMRAQVRNAVGTELKNALED